MSSTREGGWAEVLDKENLQPGTAARPFTSSATGYAHSLNGRKPLLSRDNTPLRPYALSESALKAQLDPARKQQRAYMEAPKVRPTTSCLHDYDLHPHKLHSCLSLTVPDTALASTCLLAFLSTAGYHPKWQPNHGAPGILGDRPKHLCPACSGQRT
jgi:hypothetical protein